METKFNFKSQICTNRNQSERLLALGLKNETADMVYFQHWENAVQKKHDVDVLSEYNMPAWSLHRLLSMLPSHIDEFQLKSDLVYSVEYENLIGFIQGYLYDNIIDCIEWLIKEGHFNKEYLV